MWYYVRCATSGCWDILILRRWSFSSPNFPCGYLSSHWSHSVHIYEACIFISVDRANIYISKIDFYQIFKKNVWKMAKSKNMEAGLAERIFSQRPVTKYPYIALNHCQRFSWRRFDDISLEIDQLNGVFMSKMWSAPIFISSLENVKFR